MTSCLHCKLTEVISDHVLAVGKETGGRVNLVELVQSAALVLGNLVSSAETPEDRVALLVITRNVMAAALKSSDAEEGKATEDKVVAAGSVH